MADKSNLYLNKILSNEEQEDLGRAVVKDKNILPALKKIIAYRKKETGRRDDLLDDPNYPVKRAYLDGRDKELGWLNNLLHQLEGDSDSE